MDTGTGITILGTALGGRDIIVKMLGPTADYLGEGFKDFTQKRISNVKNIFSNASKKLGDKIEEEQGSVPPKVLRGILDEGSYAEDFLSVEYFGGVLASSRTGISRDDRGAYFNSLIGRLSSYQLRLHYLLYHIVKKLFDGENVKIGIDTERSKLKVFLPFETYAGAMDFVEGEIQEFGNILNHSVFGLVKENLIDNTYYFGDLDYIRQHFTSADRGGIILQPSPLGIELFLWAYGLGQRQIASFLTDTVQLEIDENIKIFEGYKKVAG